MIDEPFRGSTAIARGVLTKGELRSGRYRRLFPDIYVRSREGPPDLELRSRAAALLVTYCGAVAGYSAAELLGASCGSRDAPAEITSLTVRPSLDLIVHRDVLAPEEVRLVGKARVTTPVRTAWDLARRLDRTEAVVALDALARIGRFDPALLLTHRSTDPGARHCRRLDEIVRLADPLAESPMETRLRLVLVDHGLPRPHTQYELRDPRGVVRARLDLAYPDARLAIEYDGEQAHRGRRRRDNQRDIAVAELGWETMRFCDADVYLTPTATAAAVERLLATRRGR